MFEYYEKVNDYLGIEDKKLVYLKYLYSGDKEGIIGRIAVDKEDYPEERVFWIF
ncbi:MAG: hypothetical protein IJ716_02590 [Lachnospiraceae bacterium]|nr:hypothetical protein [Lachnospiraceae bacterium]